MDQNTFCSRCNYIILLSLYNSEKRLTSVSWRRYTHTHTYNILYIRRLTNICAYGRAVIKYLKWIFSRGVVPSSVKWPVVFFGFFHSSFALATPIHSLTHTHTTGVKLIKRGILTFEFHKLFYACITFSDIKSLPKNGIHLYERKSWTTTPIPTVNNKNNKKCEDTVHEWTQIFSLEIIFHMFSNTIHSIYVGKWSPTFTKVWYGRRILLLLFEDFIRLIYNMQYDFPCTNVYPNLFLWLFIRIISDYLFRSLHNIQGVSLVSHQLIFLFENHRFWFKFLSRWLFRSMIIGLGNIMTSN